MARYRKCPSVQWVNERYEALRCARHYLNLRNLGEPPKSRRACYAGFELLAISYFTSRRRLWVKLGHEPLAQMKAACPKSRQFLMLSRPNERGFAVACASHAVRFPPGPARYDA